MGYVGVSGLAVIALALAGALLYNKTRRKGDLRDWK